MIVGIGCDIAKVNRFAKGTDFCERFLKKYFTLKEQQELQKNEGEKLVLDMATRFAAKEAVAKALGTGFQDGITLKDIEIVHDELGCPHVTLYESALNRANFISGNQQFNINVSLSNEQEFATAMAVIEKI